MQSIYWGWNASLVARDPVWRFPQWYGVCGKCTMTEEMIKSTYVLQAVAKVPKTWQGQTIPIRF